jgi:hypothetical protein
MAIFDNLGSVSTFKDLTESEILARQKQLGVKADGDWGKATQAAHESNLAELEKPKEVSEWSQKRIDSTNAALMTETKDMTMEEKREYYAEQEEESDESKGVQIDLHGNKTTAESREEARKERVNDEEGMIGRYNEATGFGGDEEENTLKKLYGGANALLENIGQTAPFAPSAKTGSIKGFGGIRGGDAQAKVMQGLMSKLGNKTGIRNTRTSNYRGGRPNYVSHQRPQGILSK